ncbi:MAG: dihydropteroate synthase [Terriglobales bacterium]
MADCYNFCMRPRFTWKLPSRALALGERTLVMGIVNVTPDSFSDGGRYFSAKAAVEHALGMLEEGADIIDIGGESTRPGARVSGAIEAIPDQQSRSASQQPSSPVTLEEELRRVLPVIASVRRAAPDSIISVDTYKSVVAREAVQAGAQIVNDVSALAWDPEMATTVAQMGCGVVLMHMRGRPEQWRSLPPLGGNELLQLLKGDLANSAAKAQSAGVARGSIVLDPGFGFGKNYEENYPLLARLGELHQLGFPLLSGTSRKSFLGKTAARGGERLAPGQRLYATLAAVTASILQGAHIVRVHDVTPVLEAAAVADAILNASAADERR